MRIKSISKRISFAIIGMLMMLLSAFVLATSVNTAYAAPADYFYGIGVSAKQNGCGSGFILASDIHENSEGIYLIDKIIYHTSPSFPTEIELSLEGLGSQSVFLSYQGNEQRFVSGKTVVINLASATVSFDVIIRNAGGGVIHRLTINVGFLKTDAVRFFKSGSGSVSDPYIIASAAHLDNMRLFPYSYFKLETDIELKNYYCSGNDFNLAKATDSYWRPIGYSATYAFGGVLSGDNHKIKNLNLSTSGRGFFGYAVGAKVHNVSFENAASNSAIVAQTANDCIFKDISLSGVVAAKANGTAAFVANASYSKSMQGLTVAENITSAIVVENSGYYSFAGLFYNVTGTQDADNIEDFRSVFKDLSVVGNFNAGSTSGGLVASATGLVLEDSSFTGIISCGQGASTIGGLIGAARNTDISGCASNASLAVSSGINSVTNSGGIVGIIDNGASTLLESSITDSSFTGSIILGTGSSYLGGVAGLVRGKSHLADNTVDITTLSGANYIGGIAGNVEKDIEIGAGNSVTANIISGGERIGGAIGNAAAKLTVGEDLLLDIGIVEGTNYLGGAFGILNNTTYLENNAYITVGTVKGTGSYIGGLFGYIGSSVTFTHGSNITLTVSRVEGVNYVGGLAGTFTGSLIGINLLNVDVFGSSQYVGGFAGDFRGYLENCKISGKVSASHATETYGGGVAGRYYGALGITKNVEISVTVVSPAYAGGFAGMIMAPVAVGQISAVEGIMEKITVRGASSVGKQGGGGSYLGGIAGEMRGGILKSAMVEDGFKFNTTDASNYLGGIAGRLGNGTIEDSTAYVNISGRQNLGGIAGQVYNLGSPRIGNNNKVYGSIISLYDSHGSSIGGLTGNLGYGSIGDNNAVFCDLTNNKVSGTYVVMGGAVGSTGAGTSIGNNNSITGTLTCKGSTIGGFIGSNYANVGTGNKVNVIINTTSNNEHVGLYIGGQYSGTVRNFEIAKSSKLNGDGTYVGIIGLIYDGVVGGTEDNPLILDYPVTSASTAGGLTPAMRGGRVEYVIATAPVTSTNGQAGGIVGSIENAGSYTIKACIKNSITTESAVVTATSSAGGIIGGATIPNSDYITFENCQAYNSVKGECAPNGGGTWGGFIGGMSGGFVGDNCAAYGDVSVLGERMGSPYVGGFAGSLSNVIVTSGTTAWGSVSGSRTSNDNYGYAGGFAGAISGSTVINNGCDANGTVNNYIGYSGGFVGWISGGTIGSNCLANGKILSHPSVGQTPYRAWVGGYVGRMSGGFIDFTTSYYTAGAVSGWLAGGYVGLLSSTVDGSLMTDGHLTANIPVYGIGGAGGFAYYIGAGGELKNITVTAPVSSTWSLAGHPGGDDYRAATGALVGYLFDGKVENCVAESTATVTAVNGFGAGLVGNAYSGRSPSLINSFAYNDVYVNPVANLSGSGNLYTGTLTVNTNNMGYGTVYISGSVSKAIISVYRNTIENKITGAQSAVINDSIDLLYALDTSYTAVSCEVVTGTATLVAITDGYTVAFAKSGLVVVRFTATGGINDVTYDVTFTVAIPTPDENSVDTDGYVFGEWSSDEVTIDAGMVPDKLKLYASIDGGEMKPFVSHTFINTGIYDIKLKYLEIATGLYSAEFSAIVGINAESATTISYSRQNAVGGENFTLNRITSYFGVTYQYSIDSGTTWLDMPATMEVFVATGETIRFAVKKECDAAATTTSELTAGAGTTALQPGMTVSSPNYSSKWMTEDVIFYLSFVNYRAGSYFAVSIDGGSPAVLGSGYYKISSSVSATYRFMLIDANGSTVLAHEDYIVRLDKDITKFAVNIPDKTAVTNSFNANFDITPTLSGISKVEFAPGSGGFLTISAPYGQLITANGIYKVKITNGAGKVFDYTFTVECIAVGDIKDFAVTGVPAAGKWVSQVVLEFSTSSQNIQLVEYSLNNGTWRTLPTYPSYTITVNGSYRFRAKDYENEESPVISVEIDMIDSTSPLLFLEYHTGVWTHGGEAIKISHIVGYSGITSLIVSKNGVEEDITTKYLNGDKQYIVFGRGIYTFTMTTGAGVIVIASIDIALIDPYDTLTLQVVVDDESKLGDWTAEPYVILLSVEQKVIAPLTYYYSTDYATKGNEATWKVVSTIGGIGVFNAAGNINATYYFKAETESGLKSISNPYVIMVDSDKPIVKLNTQWNNAGGKVNVAVSSYNTLCGYTVYYRAQGETIWLRLDSRETILDINQDGSSSYYEFMVTTELNIDSEIFTLEVVLDEDNPSVLVYFDGNYDGKWYASARFDLSNPNVQPSGTYYEYRILPETGTLGDEEGWRSIAGSTLIIDFSLNARLQFRAISGAGNKSAVYTTPGNVMVDYLAAYEVTPSVTGYTSGNVTLDFVFTNGGSGFASVYIIFPNGSMFSSFSPAQLAGTRIDYSIIAEGNGTYKIFVTNNTGITVPGTFVVGMIDRVVPDFTVTPSGTTDTWTSGNVRFTIFSRNTGEIRSGVTYQYSIDGGNSWIDIYNEVLLINNSVFADYIFRAITGSGVIESGGSFKVMIDKSTPDLTVNIRENTESTRSILVDLKATFGESGGLLYYEKNGGAPVLLTSTAFEISEEGSYLFYAVSSTFERSVSIPLNIVIPKVTASISGSTYAATDFAGKSYKSNVTINASSFSTVIVLKDYKEIKVDFSSGRYTFTKNGNYQILLVGESGNVVTISFTIDKPNIVLIVSVSVASAIVAAIIIWLMVAYVKSQRSLKRLIAATTQSDDPNNFLMFKKIK